MCLTGIGEAASRGNEGALASAAYMTHTTVSMDVTSA